MVARIGPKTPKTISKRVIQQMSIKFYVECFLSLHFSIYKYWSIILWFQGSRDYWNSNAILKVTVYGQVYLYDCRFRDERICFHYFHHSLRQHGLLHTRHVETINIIPECNAVFVSLSVSNCCQADVTKVWIDCGEKTGANRSHGLLITYVNIQKIPYW